MKNTMCNTSAKFGSALMVLATAGAWAWSASNESSKPAPAQAYVANPVAEPYKVLLTRSIFAKDGRAVDPRPRSSHIWSHAPSTQPTTAPAPTVVSAPPEANYVLKGVAMQDGVYTAFFEQTAENKGFTAHAGETIARGQITAMSLDGLDYSSKGRAFHILIGQDLDGKSVASATSTTPSAGSGDWRSRWHHSDAPTAAPAAPTAPSTGGPPTAANEQGGNRDFRRSRGERGEGRGGEERTRVGGQPGSDAQPQPGPDANAPADPNAPRREGPDYRDREADAAPIVVPVVRPIPDDIPPEFIDPN